MSKNQEQMKELINDVRTGKTDKEVLCKEIQKDVNCLIYPVFGEDYKKLSPRAIIDICTNLDSIDVDKNIMRQIATRVSVFMFNLIDNSTIKIDDDYEYEYGRIKEDKELFDIIKDNSRIFKDFKAYDNAPDNIKSLSRVQTIMMELYGYEMHSVDEIETLLDIDSAFILKLIAMMKDNILGISSVVENMSDYASFDEEETDDSDIKIYGAEQKAAETEAADEYEAYESENADLPDNESDEGIENDESDDEDSDEGVLFEYDMNGYENNDFDDVPVRGVSLMDKLTAFVGRVFPGVPRARRRNVVYASMVVILVVIILIVSIAAMAGGNRRKANNKNNSNEWKPMELPAYWETRGLNFDGTVWFQKEVEIHGYHESNKTIHISNDEFYAWIRELSSKPERFEGYTITMTGFVYHDSKFMSDNEFIPARLVMSCCVADVVPGGIICKYDKSDQLQNDAWITVTGKFTKGEYNGRPEPQIMVESITSAEPVNGYVYPY